MRVPKHRLEFFVHALTGFTLLLKGADKIDHQHLISGGLITGLAVVALVITFFGTRLNISHLRAAVTIYLIEATAIMITAYVFYLDGKKYLPYFMALAAFIFMVASIIVSRKHAKAHRK